jgi:GrpB-like predicted nucleotidyltransferase (UPF0157 family)
MFEEVQSVFGPYAVQPVVCRDYDSRASEVARLVGALVYKHLPQIRVEHVGSTAVPGCAGKGVVDLLIAVRHEEELEMVKELLDRMGLQKQLGQDPFPETRPMRIGSLLHDNESFLLHIHLIPENLPEADEMRFFRACLRADPELQTAYVTRKRAIIAGGATNSFDYCKIKGEFIREVLG